MRRTKTRVAIAAGCAVVTAAFCGAALAGNGHESAPGQERKDAAAPTQPAPAGTSTASSDDAQPGRKPDHTTSKWTHCDTGGQGTSTATCTAEAGTPAGKADVSKRYGNGQTAAQIAASRGAPDGTRLTGPGNSQPHKVTACGKPSNRSGGVDVHAVKSYDASACETKTETVTETKTTTGTSPAQATGTAAASTSSTSSSTASASASPTAPSTAPSTAPAASSSGTTGATGQPGPLPPAQSLPPSSAQQSAGGVLGAHAHVAPQRPAGGGALGTVGNVAGTTLPFTGFPVWAALLAALGLIAAGVLVRRGSASRV